MRFQHHCIIVLLALVLFSCDNESKEILPDISGIDINVDINRFDFSLRQIDTNRIDEDLKELEIKYPNLFPIFFNRVLRLGNSPDRSLEYDVKQFLANSNTRKVLDTVKIEYPEMSSFETQFEEAFSYMKYYLPEYIPPRIYTIVSDFGHQLFLFNDDEYDGVGIGLDLFLGETFPYKNLDPQNAAFSDYLTRSFNKDHLTRKVMELVIDDQIQNRSGLRLIDQMIFNGKKLYLLDKVLPMVNDTIIHEYTKDQLAFCKENELEIWSFFIDQGLIYETNQSKIGKYLNPSPNSPSMPSTAPGRTANYLGLQIVKAYMRRHPDTTMQELFAFNDSQALLDQSKYRPRRR